MDHIVEQYGEALSIELPLNENVTTVLRRFAHVLMNTLLSEPIISLYRLVAGEADRFPHLAELFYSRGPQPGEARLGEYFSKKMASGELRSGEVMVAAQQFVALCRSGVYQKAVLGMPAGQDRARLESDIEAALDTFERAWLIDARTARVEKQT